MQHKIRINRLVTESNTWFEVRCSCGYSGSITTDIGEARHEEAMHHHGSKERQ